VIFAAVVVAAGRGVRFGRSKQLVEIAGRPLVAWSFALFEGMPELEDLVIATEAEHVPAMASLAATYAPRLRARVVRGGATRRESVFAALEAVPERCDAALVHDGARPLVLAADVRAGMAEVRPGRGSLLAVPVIDTIKVVPRGSARVAATLDRSELWAAQTPQFGTLADLRRAHAAPPGAEATDDAMLLEGAGCEVVVVRTSSENFKVTLPADRDLAETILLARRSNVGATGPPVQAR
jgi:2-C-methyl-D-erythritol 4-phosphate cytidylyltransferase